MAQSDAVKRKIWFGYGAFLVMWTLVTYFVLFGYLSEGVLFARLVDKRPYVSDFVNSYNAGILSREYLEGNHIDVYDPILQDTSLRKIIAPVVPEAPFYLQYPPWFFAWMLPLSLVSLNVAWLLWFGLGFSALVASVFVAGRVVGLAPKNPTTIIALSAALAAFPAWLSFQLGQTSLMVNPALVAFWILLAGNKFFLSGLSTAIIMIKIQYMPVVGLVGVLHGKSKYLLGVVVATAINMILAWLAVGTQNVLRFPEALLHHETGHSVVGVAVPAMQNFRGELFLLSSGNDAVTNVGAAGLYLLACVAVVALWWQKRRVVANDPTQFFVLASITTIILLVSSLHTHAQDYVMLSPILVWLWCWNRDRSPETRTRFGSKAITNLIVAWPLFSWLFLIKELFYLIRLEPYLVWAIALLVFVMREWNADLAR